MLYIFSAELLEQVHTIGKASKNIFSAAQNFSSFSGEDDSSSQSPVISFKAHLIRLIGNLCHNNTNNQKKVWNGWRDGWMDERTKKGCFHIHTNSFVQVVWSKGKNYTLLPFSSRLVCVHAMVHTDL